MPARTEIAEIIRQNTIVTNITGKVQLRYVYDKKRRSIIIMEKFNVVSPAPTGPSATIYSGAFLLTGFYLRYSFSARATQ